MAIKFEERTIRLTGITPLMGSQSADKDLHAHYIQSKCPDDQEEVNHIATYAEEEAKGLTVFPVDPDENIPVLLDYQVKGFLKEALHALQAQNNIVNVKSKADNFLFVEPNYIFLYRRSEIVREPDDRLERPIRTEYMGNTLTSLMSSERILTPWECEFSLQLVDNVKAGSRQKSAWLSWEAIEDALTYGGMKGLGQWRNAGWGRFSWNYVGQEDEKNA